MNATPTRPWTPEEENKLGELIIGAKSVEAINGYWEYRAMANEEYEDYQRRAQW